MGKPEKRKERAYMKPTFVMLHTAVRDGEVVVSAVIALCEDKRAHAALLPRKLEEYQTDEIVELLTNIFEERILVNPDSGEPCIYGIPNARDD